MLTSFKYTPIHPPPSLLTTLLIFTAGPTRVVPDTQLPTPRAMDNMTFRKPQQLHPNSSHHIQLLTYKPLSLRQSLSGRKLYQPQSHRTRWLRIYFPWQIVKHGPQELPHVTRIFNYIYFSNSSFRSSHSQHLFLNILLSWHTTNSVVSTQSAGPSIRIQWRMSNLADPQSTNSHHDNANVPRTDMRTPSAAR